MDKICRKCGKTLPISEFYKHSQMADGHLNQCKECTKKRVMIHRNNNIDQIRKYDRIRGKTEKRRTNSRRITKSRRKKVKGYQFNKILYIVKAA